MKNKKQKKKKNNKPTSTTLYWTLLSGIAYLEDVLLVE